MQCPKCEEGILKKIQFKDGENAYVCDNCGIFWYDNEHVAIAAGHMMIEEGRDTFSFVNEMDEEQKDVQEERDREIYEFYEGG